MIDKWIIPPHAVGAALGTLRTTLSEATSAIITLVVWLPFSAAASNDRGLLLEVSRDRVPQALNPKP